MKIYILRQQGCYWHEIMLVSTSKDEAINSCNDMASSDYDNYHDWVVSEFDTSLKPSLHIANCRSESSTMNYEVEVFRANKGATK